MRPISSTSDVLLEKESLPFTPEKLPPFLRRFIKVSTEFFLTVTAPLRIDEASWAVKVNEPVILVSFCFTLIETEASFSEKADVPPLVVMSKYSIELLVDAVPVV